MTDLNADLSGATPTATGDKTTSVAEVVAIPKEQLDAFTNFLNKQAETDRLEAEKAKAEETRKQNLAAVLEKPNGQLVYDHFLKGVLETDATIAETTSRINDYYNFGLQNPAVIEAIKNAGKASNTNYPRSFSTKAQPVTQGANDPMEFSFVNKLNPNSKSRTGTKPDFNEDDDLALLAATVLTNS